MRGLCLSASAIPPPSCLSSTDRAQIEASTSPVLEFSRDDGSLMAAAALSDTHTDRGKLGARVNSLTLSRVMSCSKRGA